MPTLIVPLSLKPGADANAYERFAREVDKPTVEGFPSVDSWHVYRAAQVLGSDARPPFDYLEVVEINDPEQLGRDVQSPDAQRMSEQLSQFAEPPTFVLSEQVV